MFTSKSNRSSLARFACVLSVALPLCLSQAQAASPTLLATGFDTPVRITQLESGDLLVSESGVGDNNGQLIRLDPDSGATQIVVTGLPEVTPMSRPRIKKNLRD
jgi:hypothetical protein